MSGRAVQQAERLFKEAKRMWLATTCRKQLIEMLENRRPAEGWPFTEAVALALGPFTEDPGGLRPDSSAELHEVDEDLRNAFIQLASFVGIVEYLESSSNIEISRYAQNPSFASADEWFLRRLCIQCLQNPQAQQRMASNVFTFSHYWGEEAELLARCERDQPVLYVGPEVSFNMHRDRSLAGECENAE